MWDRLNRHRRRLLNWRGGCGPNRPTRPPFLPPQHHLALLFALNHCPHLHPAVATYLGRRKSLFHAS
jgi:hypothetical protein